MPADSADQLAFFGSKHGIAIAIVAGVFLFASVLYLIFGTFSPLEAKEIYARHTSLQKEYSNLFRKRDALAYHLAGAQV
jgi:hypothetical protein